ncbi:MAG: penicillin acylase family protein [Rhizobiaceae bacterium]|nr:penicillin acylase family protein [Rhizobiaceae bacterium]
MRKGLKWVFRILAALSVLALVIGGVGYIFISRSVTADNGIAKIPELGESVRVVRDKEGIPHITGKSIVDVAAAQGYIHAQERLWQMETFRMAGQGRLSEMFGEATVDSDKFLRTIDLDGYSRKSYERLKPETKEVLQAYARGVNAYINREKRRFEPALPPEFMILGHKPEPWEPWQSLMTVKIMALTLGANMADEVRRLALASKGFNSNEIDNLVRYNAKDNPPPLPDLRKIYGFPETGKVIQTGQGITTDDLTRTASGFDLDWPIGVTASNNWVVSGSRTTSGKVLLANDPHLGLTAPSIWYLAHLSWEEDGKRENLIGASMPSIPLVMLGRNDKVAWGFTTSYLDSQDLYVERQNPENEKQYLTENGWEAFVEREEIIKVSGKPDIKITIRSTRNGPVLPEDYRSLKKYLPKGHVAALKWIALTNDDTSMDALVDITQAENVAGVIDATRSLVSPMQSIVIGDTQGNIGFVAPARVAVRKPENMIMGRAPVPGWLPQYQWQGFLDFEQLPQIQNPENGVLFSANTKFVDQDYSPHLTWDWAEDYRHKRVEQLIVKSNAPHDVASMIAAQGDDYSPPLIQFRDEAFAQMPAGITIDSEIIDAVRNWDGRMNREGNVPLIMMAWFKEISQALLEDDLGEEFKLFEKGRISIVLAILENGGARDWCDNRESEGVQSCGEIILSSFDKAIKSLQTTYGEDWKQWRWGKAHIAYGQHRPFAKVSPLDKLFNIEVESGGGPYTLLRGQTDFGKDNPFYNRSSSSLRAIYDFSDLNKSMFIQTTGQSGNFLSSNYRNFAERWADVKYLPMTTDPAEYEKGAIGVWMMERKQ